MADSVTHSRNPSEESTSSTSGSAFPLILEHILQYPGSYEIPLRTMYTLNSAPRAQPKPKRSTASSVDSNASQASSNAPVTDATHFTSALMSHISSMPTQPCSLPPNFIITFVRRCFHPELTMVDFPQSLAALDYLKDLESRRRREVRLAFERLGINANTININQEEISAKYPGVIKWVENTERMEKKIDSLYSHLYVGLRRWILINEMCLEPFNKHNCTAMLNTLYPPSVSSASTPPTSLLPTAKLEQHRLTFFKYISAVEKNGCKILKRLQEQGARDGETHGWGSVVESLDKYLTHAKTMIDECTGMQITNLSVDEEAAKRGGRKIDSGVSFGSDRSRVSAGQSSSTTSDSRSHSDDSSSSGHPKGLSTIEKITREFKRMRSRSRSRLEVEEIPQRVATPDSGHSHFEDPNPSREMTISRLKKMKSAGSLSNLRHNNSSATSLRATSRQDSDAPTFDPVEMKRLRQLYDERQAIANHAYKKSA